MAAIDATVKLNFRCSPGYKMVKVPIEYRMIKSRFPMDLSKSRTIPESMANCIKWLTRNDWIFDIYDNMAQMNAHYIIYGTTHFKPNPKPEESFDSIFSYDEKDGYPNGSNLDRLGDIPKEMSGVDWLCSLGDVCITHSYLCALIVKSIETRGGDANAIFSIMQTRLANYMIKRWVNTESMETPRGLEMYLGSRDAATRDVIRLKAVFAQIIERDIKSIAALNELFDKVLTTLP
jgi:hypothetical protein